MHNRQYFEPLLMDSLSVPIPDRPKTKAFFNTLRPSFDRRDIGRGDHINYEKSDFLILAVALEAARLGQKTTNVYEVASRAVDNNGVVDVKTDLNSVVKYDFSSIIEKASEAWDSVPAWIPRG